MIEAQTAMGFRGDFPAVLPETPPIILVNETAAADRTETDSKSLLQCESNRPERISDQQRDGDHDSVHRAGSRGSCRPLWFTADNPQVSTVPCSYTLELNARSGR